MSLQRRLSLQELSIHSNKNDVTDDLKSLSFEHSLSPEEHQYLLLRTRYHAFTLTSCAHAAYIVGMLNQLRWVFKFTYKGSLNHSNLGYLTFCAASCQKFHCITF